MLLLVMAGAYYQYHQQQQVLIQLDDQAYQQAQSQDTSTAYQAYLLKCDLLCEHQQEAKVRLAALQTALDGQAYAAAEQQHRQDSYQAYLDNCDPLCAYAEAAQLALSDLLDAAKLKQQAALAAQRQADLVAQKKAALAADRRSYQQAKQQHNHASYQTYLNNCDPLCGHADAAKQAQAELLTIIIKKTAINPGVSTV